VRVVVTGCEPRGGCAVGGTGGRPRTCSPTRPGGCWTRAGRGSSTGPPGHGTGSGTWPSTRCRRPTARCVTNCARAGLARLRTALAGGVDQPARPVGPGGGRSGRAGRAPAGRVRIPLEGLLADRELAIRAWDLDACNRAYAELLERYQPRLEGYRAGALAGREALVERMELIHDYRMSRSATRTCRSSCCPPTGSAGRARGVPALARAAAGAGRGLRGRVAGRSRCHAGPDGGEPECLKLRFLVMRDKSVVS